MNFKTPKSWRVIPPERYTEFSIINNEDCPCEVGYVIPNKDGGRDVVSVFKYVGADASFLNELKINLDRLAGDNKAINDVNDYLEENADGYAVKQAKSLRPLYYKQGLLCGKKTFLNIMRIETEIGEAYSLQIFLPIAKDIYCFSTSAAVIDEKNPFNSFVEENEHVKDLINVVIKSI